MKLLKMKTVVLALMALASLIIVDTTRAEVAPISWQNWNIAVTDFRLTQTVDMENMFEKNPVAEDGNIFVAVTIKVKNNGTESANFRPSNLVKLGVHGAAIDAANVLTDRLNDLIEPFTSQVRRFYFEIPEAFEGESAELQFAEAHLFSQETPLAVPVTLPKKERSVAVPRPTPTPEQVSLPISTPAPTPEAQTLLQNQRKNGAETPTPAEHQNSSLPRMVGEFFPQTRWHIMTSTEISSLTLNQLRYAINEVYARYGATFPNTPAIQRQFDNQSWYRPNPSLSFEDIDNAMTDIEKANVKMMALFREGLRKR